MSTWFDIESIQNQASKILEDVNKLDVFNEEQQKNTIANKKLAAITNDFVVTNASEEQIMSVETKPIESSTYVESVNVDSTENQVPVSNQSFEKPIEFPSVLGSDDFISPLNKPVFNFQLSTPSKSNDFIIKEEVDTIVKEPNPQPVISKFNNMMISAMSIIHYNNAPTTPSALLSEQNKQKADLLLGNSALHSNHNLSDSFDIESAAADVEKEDPILQKIRINRENARNGIYTSSMKKPNFYTQSSKYQHSPLVQLGSETDTTSEWRERFRTMCSSTVYTCCSSPLVLLIYRWLESICNYIYYICTHFYRYNHSEASQKWDQIYGSYAQVSIHISHSIAAVHDDLDLITFVEYLTSPAGFGKFIFIYAYMFVFIYMCLYICDYIYVYFYGVYTYIYIYVDFVFTYIIFV